MYWSCSRTRDALPGVRTCACSATDTHRHLALLAFPPLQLLCSFPVSHPLESTERQGGGESPANPAIPQKGTDVGATYTCLYNPHIFCSVCPHISINKQTLTLPVDALNALLHSKHGNELVTWKVLSLTWAVHVQGGKKKKASLTNTIISAGISLSLPFYNNEIQAGFLL